MSNPTLTAEITSAIDTRLFDLAMAARSEEDPTRRARLEARCDVLAAALEYRKQEQAPSYEEQCAAEWAEIDAARRDRA
ncbi:hypothetical protein [Pseudonocardia sp. T1-2H]|uniref:hypothetical protein n=1 Tax=Pseudonocardia sp. T1-2H TaxID=3128899 RepID=UPI003100C166